MIHPSNIVKESGMCDECEHEHSHLVQEMELPDPFDEVLGG